MKKKILKRGMSGLLAVLMAFTALIGMGTTAFAASETAESYMVSYPRDGDAVQVYDQSTWGHSAKTYMNGWSTQSSNVTTIHCMDSYDGKVCYCIEPGVPRNVGDSYSGFGENFWDNYPSQYNNTIKPDDIKVLLGRIMQYGYQGNISTSWKSQNAADADKMAHAIATQLLVWETVIGERDADFNHVSTGGKDAVKSVISSGHPLKSRIDSYYNSIVSSVQSHVEYPSFMSKSTGKASTIELEWDGSKYVAELTDTNNVLSKFTFSASATGFNFSVSGNKLTITTDNAPTGDVTITASRSVARCGVLVWTDNKYGPDGGIQDTVTYTASVSDPVKAYIKLKVSYGSAKIIKTSEDGKVDGIKFTVVGDGVNQTVTTNSIGADGESTYNFCDTVGFQKVNFDPDLTEELKEEKIKVVLCEPGKVARVTEITNTLDGLQAAVKGDIEAFYPFEEAVCIVCNEEGKFNGMDPNRAVYGENHEIMDVIFGPFFICDCSGQNFGSLDREQLERFKKQFRNPEKLISVNGKILSVPYNPQPEKSR